MKNNNVSIGANIVHGIFQGSTVSDIRNPVLKLFLVILPIFVGVLAILQRRLDVFQDYLTINVLLWVCIVLYLMITIDLRPQSINLVLKRFIVLSGVAVMINFAVSTGIGNELYSMIPIVKKISPSTWPIIFLFGISIMAVWTISSRDALWLGRKLMTHPKYIIYATFVTAYFVVQQGIASRARQVKAVAQSKFYLSRGQNHITRILRTMRIVVILLINHMYYLVLLSMSLLTERGFFSISYKDYHGWNFGGSDVIVIFIFVLCVMGLFLL